MQAEEDLGDILRTRRRTADTLSHQLRAIRMLDSMIADDTTNQEAYIIQMRLYRNVAACYGELAAQATNSGEQLRNWRQALVWWKKSRDPDAKSGIETAERAIAGLSAKR